MENCSSGVNCLPMIVSWEASSEIQSGDVLLVEIDDKFLLSSEKKLNINGKQLVHKHYS
jgi:hypothetical protein